MRQSTLLRFCLIGMLVAAGLGLVSCFALRSLMEASNAEERHHTMLSVAQTIESAPYAQSVQDPHLNGRDRHGWNLWVLSGDGHLLASNSPETNPVSWTELKKPSIVHNFTFYYETLHLVPEFTLVKLDSKDGAYLLLESKRRPSLVTLFGAQLAFYFFVIGIAVFLAVGMIFIYLREKSREARGVLSRLEKGDLQARFQIKRIDEIGSLMSDFNRMASEIERLVYRVQETEKARRNILEELSHDIRTPLTSLTTSVETLSDHLDEMPKSEQREFIAVIRMELSYFVHLIEDLFFIANLGEPRYKQTTQKVDLLQLLQSEVRARQAQGKNKDTNIQWDLTLKALESTQAVILGDPLLIQRLFKNALDNASKHAESKIRMSVSRQREFLVVVIENDGLAISDEAIAEFGNRKKHRPQFEDIGKGVSLGFGSIIMKTILQLHGGESKIERTSEGTRLTLSLPQDSSAEATA